MIGCLKVKRVYWILGRFRRYRWGWTQAESLVSPAEGGSARLMLPLDRRCRFMASSVGLPRPLEGARGLVGGGSPAALVMERRPLTVPIPRAAPVAVIDGANFLELAGRLLPLRLRFLTTSVLRDNGRVPPWSSCRRGERYVQDNNPNSLLTFRRTLTKNKPHILHSDRRCGSRLQSGAVAALQFVHWVCPSP